MRRRASLAPNLQRADSVDPDLIARFPRLSTCDEAPFETSESGIEHSTSFPDARGPQRRRSTLSAAHHAKIIPRRRSVLLDATRQEMEDEGIPHNGRELTAPEKEFVLDAAAVKHAMEHSLIVTANARALVDEKIAEIEKRRSSVRGPPPEHFTFTQYQQYLRTKNRLNDGRAEIPEGNLTAILSILKNQSDLQVLMKGNRRLVRIGDFIVEVDPADLDVQISKTTEVKLGARAARFRDSGTQTETITDNTLLLQMQELCSRLEESLRVVDAQEKIRREQDLFHSTVMSRISVLKSLASRMLSEQQTEMEHLATMCAEAMTQNERLWVKLEAFAQGATPNSLVAKEVKGMFLSRLQKCSSNTDALKWRLQRAEASAMELQDQFHQLQNFMALKIEAAKKEVIHPEIRKQLDHLQSALIMEESGASLEGPAAILSTARRIVSLAVATFDVNESETPEEGTPSLSNTATSVVLDDPTLEYEADPEMQLKEVWKKLKGLCPGSATGIETAVESIFGSLESAVTSNWRAIVDLFANLTNPASSAQAVTDIQDVMRHVRHTAHLASVEFSRVVLDSFGTVKQQLADSRAKLQEDFQAKAAALEESSRLEVLAVRAAAAAERKVVFQKPPPILLPRLAPFSFENVNYQHPQDVLQLVSGYITELTLEVCQMCEAVEQPLPTRVEGIFQLVHVLRMLQSRVTTNEGLVDGIDAVDEAVHLSSNETRVEEILDKWLKPHPEAASPLSNGSNDCSINNSSFAGSLNTDQTDVAGTLSGDQLRKIRSSVGSKAMRILGASELAHSQHTRHIKLQECMAAPDVAAVVLQAVQSKAALDFSPSPGRRQSTKKKTKILREIAVDQGDDGGATCGWKQDHSMVHRATSPIEFPKKKPVDSRAVIERQQQHEKNIADNARRQALMEFEQSDTRQQMVSAVQYLRLALAYLLSSSSEPVEELVDSNALKRPSVEMVEFMTALILQLNPDKTEQIRKMYNKLRTERIGERSRCVLFSNDMVSRGVTCELILGKESILQSPEAIQHAVTHDVRVFSDQRHQKRIMAALHGPAGTSPRRQELVSNDTVTDNNQEENGYGSPSQWVAKGPISTQLPAIRGSESKEDLPDLAVRRLQGQHHVLSHTPEPVTHWQQTSNKRLHRK